MTTVHRPRVFLDINIGGHPAGRLTIELFADKTPRTCENFRQLCTGEYHGMTYAKAPLHRIIDEFMIQGGDITNGDGTGTASIYNGEFEDENLNWREMDAAGLVCSANRGKDTNGSQFFVTLDACPHLNGKHTILGRMVAGQDTLARIAKVQVDKDDRPVEPVLIERCGELEKRQKSAPKAQPMPSANSGDRGRRRKSDGSDEEMEDTPEPQAPRTRRRQSDNVIDEGLRGRPRQRSGSRSVSRPLSTPEEDADGEDIDHGSATTKQKRKREPSPSRHVDAPRDHEAEDEYERRRRRSLPNQYADKARNRTHGDEDRYRPSPRRDEDRYAGRRREDQSGKQGDGRYRPSRNREDEGRLGSESRHGEAHHLEYEAPVKFKGRGVMKYREPGRL